MDIELVLLAFIFVGLLSKIQRHSYCFSWLRMDNDQLRAKTEELRKRIQAGTWSLVPFSPAKVKSIESGTRMLGQ